jgi:hypothetical protein
MLIESAWPSGPGMRLDKCAGSRYKTDGWGNPKVLCEAFICAEMAQNR